MSWSSLTAAFLGHRTKQGLAPATLVATARWLEELEAFCRERRMVRPEQLSPEQLLGFRQALLWSPGRAGCLLAPNTVDQGLRVVRSFLRWAHREGFLALDPTLDLVLPRPLQPARRLLTGAELDALHAQLDLATPLGLRDAALLELLGRLRLGELLSRDLAHVGPGCRSLSGWELAPGGVLAVADYLERGRPFLVRGSREGALLLGARGARLGAGRVGQRLRELARSAGLEVLVGPRRLLQSAALDNRAGSARMAL